MANRVIEVPLYDKLLRQPLYEGDRTAGLVTEEWARFYAAVAKGLSTATIVKKRVELTLQADSIVSTDMSGGTLPDGLYRLSWYALITQAATTSSSLQMTFTWVSGGVTQTQNGSAITGNTTTSGEVASLALIRCDAATPITYASTYASVGAVPMQYSLDIALELLGAAES